MTLLVYQIVKTTGNWFEQDHAEQTVKDKPRVRHTALAAALPTMQRASRKNSTTLAGHQRTLAPAS
jgi:hypothetical protein